jgi:MOSC domain-containing protein YiiM
MTARVISVNTSERTGQKKEPQPHVELLREHGIRGDAHAGDWHRQVSLLAEESIQKMQDCGADVGPGSFGENVTTRGIVVHELPVGTRLRLGESVCEVTQIGKLCHDRCAIFHQVGDCVMPREGIFVRVLKGGVLRPGDAVEVLGPAPAGEAGATAAEEVSNV